MSRVEGFQNFFFFTGSPRFCAAVGVAFFSVSATTKSCIVLRGTIVNGTYDIHKNLYV